MKDIIELFLSTLIMMIIMFIITITVPFALILFVISQGISILTFSKGRKK